MPKESLYIDVVCYDGYEKYYVSCAETRVMNLSFEQANAIETMLRAAERQLLGEE